MVSKQPMKLIHLLSIPGAERERKSVKSLMQLRDLGFQYVAQINPPYEGEIPPGKYFNRPKGAYGCYKAHRAAVAESFSDFIMVCECDCTLLIPPKDFAKIVDEICEKMVKLELTCVAIGGLGASGQFVEDLYRCRYVSAIHCLLYRNYCLNLLEDHPEPWLPYDYFLAATLGVEDKLAVTPARYAGYLPGVSLIDGDFKTDTALNGIGWVSL